MKKALKGNLVFLWIILAVIIGIRLVDGPILAITTLKFALAVGLMATIIYFIPFKIEIKGTILATIPAVFALILSAIAGGEIKMFYVFILSLLMQSLYLNRKLLAGYGAFMSLTLIIIYFTAPTILIDSASSRIEFIIPMAILLIIYFILIFLTSIEKEKLCLAQEELGTSQEVSESLKITLKEVSHSIARLRDKFSNCNGKIKTGKEGVQNITRSMEELVISTEAVTTTVSNISRSASISRENFSQIHELTSYIKEYFKDAEDTISASQAGILNLRQAMDKKKEASNGNYQTIQEFSKQAEDIASFADKIAGILNQINLLALDASIEAVREGNQAEKFANVAEKIRILSEENTEHINKIRRIIKEPIKAMDLGPNLEEEIKHLNEKLKKIKNNSNLAGEKIGARLGVANTIKNEFNIIDNDIHNITVVIEENARRFEEILDRMEYQKDIINNASVLMEEIKATSDNLDKLIMDHVKR